MKKVLLALAAFSAICVMADDNKVVFDQKYIWKNVKEQVSLQDGVVTIKGNPENKYNAFLTLVVPVGDYVPGKNLELKGELKTQITEKSKGYCALRFRLVGEKGKSVAYYGITIRKTQDWTKMKTLIKLSPKEMEATKRLEIYCIGTNLDADSFGQFRDVEWEFED